MQMSSFDSHKLIARPAVNRSASQFAFQAANLNKFLELGEIISRPASGPVLPATFEMGELAKSPSRRSRQVIASLRFSLELKRVQTPPLQRPSSLGRDLGQPRLFIVFARGACVAPELISGQIRAARVPPIWLEGKLAFGCPNLAREPKIASPFKRRSFQLATNWNGNLQKRLKTMNRTGGSLGALSDDQFQVKTERASYWRH